MHGRLIFGTALYSRRFTVNKAISLVLVRAPLEYTSRVTSHNNKTTFQSTFDV